MGHNATVVFCMDAINGIKTDPDFSNKLYFALLQSAGSGSQTVNVSIGPYVNGAMVVESHHADYYVPVFVGCNGGVAKFAGMAGYLVEDMDAVVLKSIKALAKSMGYKVIKDSKGNKDAKR